MSDPKVTTWVDVTGKTRTIKTEQGPGQSNAQCEEQHAAEVAAAKKRWPPEEAV